MKEIDEIADLFERPVRTAAITGMPITISLSADSAQAVASLLRLLNGQMSADLTRPQIERTLRILFSHIGIYQLMRLWILTRFCNALSNSKTPR